MEGEKDINKLFEMLKEEMPVPDELKDVILIAFTYILSM